MPKTFDHTTPSGNQSARYVNLQRAFEELERAVADNVPPGREKSLALTKLEECAMWANKGVSRGDAVFNG